MTVSKEEMKKIRLDFVHQMNDYIENTRDEDIYDVWMYEAIPDHPYEEDFELYADDPKEFEYLCKVFNKLVHRYYEKMGISI